MALILQIVYANLQLSQPIRKGANHLLFNLNEILTFHYKNFKCLAIYEPGCLCECELCTNVFVAKPLSVGKKALALT